MTSRRRSTRVRRASIPIVMVASAGALVAIIGNAGAISGGSVSPTELSASGQAFTVNYTGKTTDPATPNLIVQECIADDSKVGFDVEIDCSPFSLVNYSNVAAPDGSVTYGGDPNNTLAPFRRHRPEQRRVVQLPTGLGSHQLPVGLLPGGRLPLRSGR